MFNLIKIQETYTQNEEDKYGNEINNQIKKEKRKIPTEMNSYIYM